MSVAKDEIQFRPARAGDGPAVYQVTCLSVRTLQVAHYSVAQLDNWMGARTPDWHEALITNGRMVVATRSNEIVGFVHSLPGEINRLFVLPSEVGEGLGKRLLEIGVANARIGHDGAIRLASSLNAVPFYERFGFKVVERGYFPPEIADGRAELVKMEL